MRIDSFYIDEYYIQMYITVAFSIIAILPVIFKQGRQSGKNTPIWLIPFMYIVFFSGMFINSYYHISIMLVASIIQAIVIYRSCFITEVKWRPYIKKEKDEDE